MVTQAGFVRKDQCGTMPYVAPEIFLEEGYEPSAADVFSLGAVLLEVLCGSRAFNRFVGWQKQVCPCVEHVQKLADCVRQRSCLLEWVEDRATCPEEGPVPEHLTQLILAMLEVELRRRCTSQDAEDTLNFYDLQTELCEADSSDSPAPWDEDTAALDGGAT